MDDDRLDAEEKRYILRQVAAYRDLCDQVRSGAKGSLFFGGLMLVLWWQLFSDKEKFEVFGLIYLALACLEFGAGLLNRFFPSAEGVLADGVVLTLFGGFNLVRHYLRWQAGGPPFTILTFFSAYWVYSGVQGIKGYFTLRKLFTHRPSAAHVRWFDELIHEVRTGNPETDPDALDLPTVPRVKAKLLGDTALVLAGAEVVVAAREQFELVPAPARRNDDRPRVLVALNGYEFGECQLSPENAQNYTKWKAGK
jgi:hypothetical protein